MKIYRNKFMPCTALGVALTGLLACRPPAASSLNAEARVRDKGYGRVVETVSEVQTYYAAEDNPDGPWKKCLGPAAFPTQSPISLVGFDAAGADTATVGVTYAAAPPAFGTFGASHSGFQIEGLSGRMVFGSGPHRDSAPLTSFHFHKPAEHLLPDGSRAAMELHLVHQDPTTGRAMVLAVMLNGRGPDNPSFGSILMALHSALNAKPSGRGPSRVMLTMADLLPRSLSGWAYSGSLTTPDCGGPVTFAVAATPLAVSDDQIAAYPYGDTARELQTAHLDRASRNYQYTTEAPIKSAGQADP